MVFERRRGGSLTPERREHGPPSGDRSGHCTGATGGAEGGVVHIHRQPGNQVLIAAGRTRNPLEVTYMTVEEQWTGCACACAREGLQERRTARPSSARSATGHGSALCSPPLHFCIVLFVPAIFKIHATAHWTDQSFGWSNGWEHYSDPHQREVPTESCCAIDAAWTNQHHPTTIDLHYSAL